MSSTVVVQVHSGNVAYGVALYPGIPEPETLDLLHSAFRVDENSSIVGLVDDKTGVILPFSLLCLRPDFFSASYELLFLKSEPSEPFVDPRSSDFSVDAFMGADSDDMLSMIKTQTKFSELDVGHLIEGFQKHSSDGVFVNKHEFEKIFEPLIAKCATKQEQLLTQLTLDRLFQIFDVDHNNAVDFAEFLSGCAFLCGGSVQDKIHCAFKMFDYDGDGFITIQEMERYFQSFFGVVLALSKDLRDRFKNLTAKTIAAATAKQCMKDADTNRDGHISFEEFTRWYRKISAYNLNE